MKKKLQENIAEKGEIAHFEQFHLFPLFSMHSVSSNPLIATFQLSSPASLNSGKSQNGVLGDGLTLFETDSDCRLQLTLSQTTNFRLFQIERICR